MPVTDQVQAFIGQLSPQERSAGISLNHVQQRIKGTRGRVCHPGLVGGALRSLGWRRFRMWNLSPDATFEALWFPPDAGKTKEAIREGMRDIAMLKRLSRNIKKELKHVCAI